MNGQGSSDPDLGSLKVTPTQGPSAFLPVTPTQGPSAFPHERPNSPPYRESDPSDPDPGSFSERSMLHNGWRLPASANVATTISRARTDALGLTATATARLGGNLKPAHADERSARLMRYRLFRSQLNAGATRTPKRCAMR